MPRLLRPFGALEGDGRTAFPPADEQELSPQAPNSSRAQGCRFASAPGPLTQLSIDTRVTKGGPTWSIH